MSDLHVVFGAGGGAGSAVVRVLASRGLPSRAVARRPLINLPEGAEFFSADAMDHNSVLDACRGAKVVYHCVNTPYATWASTLPHILEGIIAGATSAGARLVYCDNLYSYGPTREPLKETTPAAATARKGALRVRLTERLLEANRSGRLEVTVGRASDFYGPGATNTIAGMLVFPAVVKGTKAHWIGNLDVPHTMSYIDDVASGLITLGSDPRAVGEIWHIPSGPEVTGREFIQAAFEAAGKPPRVGVYSRNMIALVGLFNRQLKESLEVLYQFEHPFIMNTDKFAQTFTDHVVTDFRQAIATTLAWTRSHQKS